MPTREQNRRMTAVPNYFIEIDLPGALFPPHSIACMAFREYLDKTCKISV